MWLKGFTVFLAHIQLVRNQSLRRFLRAEGEAKKGDPKNEGISNDVVENTRTKNVTFSFETMCMKTKQL